MEKLEYELQHFGFSSEQVKLERRYFIKRQISLLLNDVVNTTINKSNVSEEAKDKLRVTEAQVAGKMISAMEPTIQEIEKLDDQYLTIPDNILLPQDFRHIKKVSEVDEANLKIDIESLTKQFLQNAVMISAIEKENAKYIKLKDYIAEEEKISQAVFDTLNTLNPGNTHKIVQNVISTLKRNKLQVESKNDQ